MATWGIRAIPRLLICTLPCRLTVPCLLYTSTGLKQNVDELLRSDTARLMLANSEFLVMLNQSATDRAELAKLLNISDNQLGYVTNVPAGCGLIRCAGNIVPFTNSFPKNTKLYKLMSTNPSEKRE